MGTAPPPPFGTPQTGPAPTRRSLRIQRRAAADYARLQRNQDQLKRRALERRSITGPVLLLAAGSALLLLETGHLQWNSALLWLSVWWPAILIGAGVIMLAEWAIDLGLHPVDGRPATRRVLGGLAGTLLVCLVLAGVALSAARHSAAFLQTPWIQENLDDAFGQGGLGHWDKWLGVRSEFTSDLRAPLSPSGQLIIDDPRGDVTVTGSSDDGQVHVAVRQHLVSWDQGQVEQRRLHEEPHFSGNGDHLTLATMPQQQDSVDLTISLPHSASLVIHSGNGDVSVEEVRGAATIAAGEGDVKLTALRGSVHLSTQSEQTDVVAHSLGGGLVMEGRSGDITLSDVTGGVTLKGDFFGTTQLERVQGPVNFQSSFTHLDCAGISGSLVIDGRDDLSAHNLQGPLTIATSDRNLTLDGIRGATNISNRNGSVSVTLASPLHALYIANENGEVSVSVPEHAGFSLRAETADGEIDNDLGLSGTKVGETTTVIGPLLGGGPVINIKTTNDDIHVNRAPAPEGAA